MEDLPIEIIQAISTHLDPRSFCNLRLTGKFYAQSLGEVEKNIVKSKHKYVAVFPNGEMQIQKNNKRHVVRKDGTEMWFVNNLLHRDNRPAVIKPDNSKYWYNKGILIKYEVENRQFYLKDGLFVAI